MKKMLVITLLLILVSNVSAQLSINNFEYSFLEDVIYFVGYNNKLYQVNTMDKTYIDLTGYVRVDGDGYYLLKNPIQGQEPILSRNIEYYLLLGSNQLFYLADKERIQHLQKSNEDTQIESIDATSYLIEKTSKGNIEYAPSNLLSRYFSTDQEFRFELIPSALPWALKEKDTKKTTLDVTTKYKTNGLIFLNGYIDFQNRGLYKKNSRAKELEITDIHTNKTAKLILKDSIQYQEFELPFITDSFRIRIVSVYPGEKYQDVCISSIIPFFNEQMSKQTKVYRTNVLDLSNGYFLTKYEEAKKF